MDRWTRVAIGLMCFSAVVFVAVGIIERSLGEFAFGAVAACAAYSTWKSAPRRRNRRI